MVRSRICVVALVAVVGALGCGRIANKQTNSPTSKDLTRPVVDENPYQNENSVKQEPVLQQAADGIPEIVVVAPRLKPAAQITPSPACRPDSNGHFSFERHTLAEGWATDREGGNHAYGTVGGCIHRPLRETWAAAMSHVSMQWNGTNSSQTDLGSSGQFAKMFDVHYSVTRWVLGMSFTATWDMHWTHVISKGTAENPLRILINYHRYQGSSHVGYWEGTVALDRVADDVTGYWARDQIRADRTGPDDAAGSANDIFDKLSSEPPNWAALPK